ncbi:hypothetical protein GGD81_004064 [Rhodobium orientis]|nr:DUF2971 domain-containing protein [Rhodobium orientis]MBB4304998.1 hypothetical protein [Rhodobium orientis]
MDALLGPREELERQTVYFAPPEYLNDPMEGMRLIYWRGDRITWRNLLRHYVICLQNRVFQALLRNQTERLNPQSIAVFQSLDNLPTPEARALCEACIEAVEGGELHAALLDLLANADRNVSFSELQRLLRTVHLDWLGAMHNIFCQRGLAQQTEPMSDPPRGLVDSLRAFKAAVPTLQDQTSDVRIEFFHEIGNLIGEQMVLLSVSQLAEVLEPKRESLFFDFPTEYLNNLIKLIYPPWYVACFSAQHDNAAMWSYYAENHQGCCLVFATHETGSRRKLRLNGPTGYGSDGISCHTTNPTLQPVRYSSEEHRIEFFTNIGRLPFNQTMRNWFQDDAGTTSPLADHLSDERQEEWRDGYWEKFAPPLLRKLRDWEHEQESRIILSDILNIRGTDEGRTFTYDYDTLDGIIFGINTSLSNKVRIMRIIDTKLADRSVSRPFKFYQAKYNPRSGRIEAHHLGLLRHEEQ